MAPTTAMGTPTAMNGTALLEIDQFLAVVADETGRKPEGLGEQRDADGGGDGRKRIFGANERKNDQKQRREHGRAADPRQHGRGRDHDSDGKHEPVDGPVELAQEVLQDGVSSVVPRDAVRTPVSCRFTRTPPPLAVDLPAASAAAKEYPRKAREAGHINRLLHTAQTGIPRNGDAPTRPTPAESRNFISPPTDRIPSPFLRRALTRGSPLKKPGLEA